MSFVAHSFIPIFLFACLGLMFLFLSIASALYQILPFYKITIDGIGLGVILDIDQE